MNFFDELGVVGLVDVTHERRDVADDPGAVEPELVQVVDGHVRKVLLLDVRVFEEKAASGQKKRSWNEPNLKVPQKRCN